MSTENISLKKKRTYLNHLSSFNVIIVKNCSLTLLEELASFYFLKRWPSKILLEVGMLEKLNCQVYKWSELEYSEMELDSGERAKQKKEFCLHQLLAR